MDPVALKGILKTLLLPPAGVLLLVAAGLLWSRQAPRAGRALAWTGVVLGWIAAMPASGDAVFRALEAGQRPLSAEDAGRALAGPRPPAAVVILGAGVRRDGLLEPSRGRPLSRTTERLLAGARVARMTGLPVLVTGARPADLDVSEGEIARRVLENELWTPVRWVETRAWDTEDNARLSAQMLRADGIDSVVLVTHAYHMPRARLAFERAGLSVLAAPHHFRAGRAGGWRPWMPSADGLEATWIGLHEAVGLAWYRWRGHA